MPSNAASRDLGPWKKADLEGTVARYSGEGADDNIDSVGRLGRRVCQLSLQRLRQSRDIRRDAIAIFLLAPVVPSGVATTREPMLGDGSVEVCGKIWFVNVMALSGHALAAECEEDGSMFKQVERLGLGHVPAVVFNPKVDIPIVRIYDAGLSDESRVEVVEIADAIVTLSEIRGTIDLMHEKHLITPSAQVSGASMWTDATRYWAASNAEAIAQLQIKTALSVRFFSCDIRHEQTMRAGRSDLEIVQRHADGTTTTPAELEIKVLRERNRRGKKWSDGWNEKWIRRGIAQAAAYRDDRDAQSGMLCCFDMRQRDRGSETTFATIKARADSLRISLYRKFLYNSADAWRAAKYGG